MNRDEIRRTYCGLGERGRVPCMIYEPANPAKRKRVGIVLMHSDDNYLEFLPAPELASRGYIVAAAAVSSPGELLEEKIWELGEVVALLRNDPGVSKVVLFGHSGGATLMSAYQSIAENGPEIFRRDRLLSIGEVGDTPPADGVMLLDSNFGNGVMSLLSLDPSVTDEETGMRRIAALNLFSPENGYDPYGCHYTPEFTARFLRAQAERMNRIIDFCEERVAMIGRGMGRFADDEPLLVPGGVQTAPCNKLFPQLPEVFSHTRRAYPLIHAGGSVENTVIPCRRVFRKGRDTLTSCREGALSTTVKNFLESSAVRVDPDTYRYDASELHGIDWTSSFCVTVGNAENLTVPMLLMGMTGSYEYIAAEHILEHAVRAKDKTIAFVEGASHNFTPAKEAERWPGKNCFDFADRWLSERFL